VPFALGVQLLDQRVRVVLYRRRLHLPFYARWWYAGRQHHASTGHQVLTTAKAAARRLVEDAAQRATAAAAGAGPAANLSATAADLVEAYLADRWPGAPAGNLSLRDARVRLRNFAGIVGAAGAPPADRVPAAVPPLLATRAEMSARIQAHLDARRSAGKGPRTLINDRLVLSRWCRWLLQSRGARWESNPAAACYLNLPRAPVRAGEALTDADVAALLAAARGHPLWPVIVLCLGVGLRPREAVRVNRADVTGDPPRLRVTGKGRERVIVVPPWAARELRAVLAKPKRAAPAGCAATRNVATRYTACSDPQTANTGARDALASATRLYPWGPDRAFASFRALRRVARLPLNVSLQALRRTAARRAAPALSPAQYAQHFGHSLAVASRHYLGWGLLGNPAALAVLDYSRAPRNVKRQR